jgi:hypothetical protein
MRKVVTLLDGSELQVGDPCRVQMFGSSRWRLGTVAEIMQGTGVDRVFISLKSSGEKIGPISRYRLKPH